MCDNRSLAFSFSPAHWRAARLRPRIRPAGSPRQRVAAAAAEPGNWLVAGHDFGDTRFSPLRAIDEQNVGRAGARVVLRLRHSSRPGSDAGRCGRRALHDQCLEQGAGVSRGHRRTAVAVRSQGPGRGGRAHLLRRRQSRRRGLQGRVYVGTLDGRLIALDAKSGKPAWSVLTVDPHRPYAITGVPLVAQGKVIIGNAGAEYGVRGYVTAYDARTGKQAWRFFVVPGNPALGFENEQMRRAAQTWSGEWWKDGGGGTVWNSFSYDPELGLVYMGTGNASPWSGPVEGGERGDALYTASIVAVHVDNGRYAWHYQTTPGDVWDYDADQSLTLATLRIDGKSTQGPHAGQQERLLLRARSGHGRAAVGEEVRAGQLGQGRRPQSPDARRWCRTRTTIRPASCGSACPAGSAVTTGSRCPSARIPGWSTSRRRRRRSRSSRTRTSSPSPSASTWASTSRKPACRRTRRSRPRCWRASRGSCPPGIRSPGTRSGAPIMPGPWNGGLLSTAGNLVFQGTAAGEFVAYRASDGAKLWSFPAQTGIIAAPMTYTVDGRQYVSVVVGWGGVFPLVTGELAYKSGRLPNRSRVLTFALDGKAALPAVERRPSRRDSRRRRRRSSRRRGWPRAPSSTRATAAAATAMRRIRAGSSPTCATARRCRTTNVARGRAAGRARRARHDRLRAEPGRGTPRGDPQLPDFARPAKLRRREGQGRTGAVN